MHENREISSAPWSKDQGRSANAKSRTADMHVLEKSDCAVVPVNQPNKGGQPSAEAGEGRAQTKENIVQSHMHPTQSGKREHRVADRRILRLIQKWLKAGVSEDGQWSETKVGTPQGAVASPLIANVYLHYLFDLWADVWRKKVAK